MRPIAPPRAAALRVPKNFGASTATAAPVNSGAEGPPEEPGSVGETGKTVSETRVVGLPLLSVVGMRISEVVNEMGRPVPVGPTVPLWKGPVMMLVTLEIPVETGRAVIVWVEMGGGVVVMFLSGRRLLGQIPATKASY